MFLDLLCFCNFGPTSTYFPFTKSKLRIHNKTVLIFKKIEFGSNYFELLDSSTQAAIAGIGLVTILRYVSRVLNLR